MVKKKLTRGERNIKWIERACRIPEGPLVGQKVELREWQKNELLKIYDNEAGTRRAIISFGRKNAKTTLVAMLLLLHLVGPEKRFNSQLFSSATSREQAALLFALAAKMIRMSAILRSVVVIRDARKELFCPELGTVYRALSAEASTAYGLSPVFIVHDELGQVRGGQSELYEALETATGAQKDPLSVIISTQAPKDVDLLSILIDDALQAHDPHVTVSLYSAPATDDPFDLETVRKANPALSDFLNQDEVMAMAEDARRMPSREAEFRNLVLNQRVQALDPFISEFVWDTCNGPVADDWGNAEVYGGLDLSATKDLTALALVAKVDGKWQVKPTFWLPDEGLRERSRLDHVPYDVWKREGYLTTTPGKSVEYDWVAFRLRQICNSMRIKKIAFDRWQFHHLRASLQRNGFGDKEIEDKFVEFGQGYKSMSPALRTLESLILNKKVAHGGHLVLKMCAANAVVTRDAADNKKLDKAKAHGRIDGMVALAMAVGIAETAKEKPREPQLMIV